ncbi:ammonium transporter [Agromyces cerinus]|uniref:Ammonium transporter n=1 Tax=Agromyces cerinus subsp. cerinus TaxID=232089 RepID=A0A1N6G0W3_9MICO|nr:ammonium transporter [Agromyces cerinus]SIO01120.1 ammonium transporter [Agromyces cerinus subsp. cerinus]
MSEAIDSGDTAWVLVCAAMVLFMVPGLAFFYAGLVRRSNVLVIMQQNIVPLAVVSITWVLVGFSLAFGPDTWSGLVGDLSLFGLNGVEGAPAPALHVVDPDVAIPTLAFVVFQMMFAIITPALLTGATVGRLRPLGWVVVLVFWSILVYPVIAHWLFDPDGWLAQLGAQDWAGGIVVHAAAGAAALAVLAVVGRRSGWPTTRSIPHSIPLAVVGGGILWFGWFGFNAGGALQANEVAAQALLNTQVAAAGGMAAWLVCEVIRTKRATVIGGITGAVAGLATITPAAGYVNTLAALAIGIIAGIVCTLALKLKTFFRFDDALDVIAVHFVGGILGSLLLGLFGSAAINSAGRDGLFSGGGWGLLGDQALALVVVIAYAFVVTWIIAMLTQVTVGLRASSDPARDADQEEQGSDAYHLAAVLTRDRQGGESSGRHAGPPIGADGQTITAVIEVLDAEALRAELFAAGAQSIVLDEVTVAAGNGRRVSVREQSADVGFVRASRVEVQVPASAVVAVQAVLSRGALSGPTTRTDG